ncbi:MAG TPA: D-alanyl-D-alanine carboxypeptidase family protein [Conexibacter sp.]|nr:D-alanyl-D-alanine carboxypeptidase family protein [Conexibacter sp.]
MTSFRARSSRRLLPLLLAAVLCACACVAAAAPHAAAAAPSPPALAAPSAAVFESSTGRPVFGRAAGARRLIASTTKMMTALVAATAVRLDRVCTAPPYAAGPLETQIGLRAGERMRVRDLLRALLLPSANDAAATLAVCVAGSRAAFVARMNQRAKRLGLAHTRFSTPIGLDDPGNYSTAADLVRLAIAARAEPFLRETMNLRSAVLRSGDRPRTVVNRNALVQRVPWVNGVKTGHTSAAGYILVASGTQRGTTFVAAVLGDPSESARDADALALLKWAFASFRVATPVRRGVVYARPAVKHRPDEHVAVIAVRDARELLRRDARVRLVIDVPRELEGPLPRRAVVGSATVRADGRPIARIPLVTRERVPEVGLLEQVGRALDGPGSLVAVAALLVGLGALLVRARGARRRERRRSDMEAA